MGSAIGGFWWRTFRFSWFGHQSRFDCAVPPETGQLAFALLRVHVSYDCIMSFRHGNPSGTKWISEGGIRNCVAVEQEGHRPQ